MRPASEIHSALDLLDSELSRQSAGVGADNMRIARDVLAWVAGGRAPDDGSTLWLVGFLLDDPQKLDDTPPEVN